MRHIQGAHVETHFGSYLSQILMDFVSIWVILKLLKIGPKSPKSPNSVGSGSDQNPDRKAREPSPDRANNRCCALVTVTPADLVHRFKGQSLSWSDEALSSLLALEAPRWAWAPFVRA